MSCKNLIVCNKFICSDIRKLQQKLRVLHIVFLQAVKHAAALVRDGANCGI